MNDFTNFSNGNKKNEYIIYKDNNNPNNDLMAYSSRNISTTYNSYISNDFQKLKNNNLNEYVFNNKFNTNNNEKDLKTINNYYKKKDYSKFLNAPQSNYSTFYDSKNNFNSKSHFLSQNLNSNLIEKKVYNKLKISELIKIAENRKKFIEESNKLENLKKLKITLEEEKILQLMKFNEDIKVKSCEEGMQTSLVINENENENKGQNKNIFDIEINNNIITKEKNTIENDLVNIGNDTMKYKNSNLNNSFNDNTDLIFNIEVNNDNSQYEQNNINNDSLENRIREYNSSTSSNKENEISRVEEYNINKDYLKNETKSDIQNYIDENEKIDKKEKINLKLNKSKSVLSFAINRYEIFSPKNSLNFESNGKQKIIKDMNPSFIDFNKNFEKHIENQKNIYSNDCIKKISINKNEKKKLVNKLEIVGVKQNLKNKIESNRPKKKRQIDNYSYYFKIKEKSKSIKDLFQ